jgi:gliding motility-associated-like protein
LILYTLDAQRQANIWHFGDGAGLDFSSGTPQPFESNIFTFEGCASYCDANGNLLFYTNGGGRDSITAGQPGGKIWNGQGGVLRNLGNTEGGGYSAYRSSVFIPKPGTENQFYLFTMEEIEAGQVDVIPGEPQGRGLSYFELDLCLNDGLGGVTIANEQLYVPAFEALAATIHADGQRYWIFAMDTTAPDDFKLVRLLVDGTGISAADIATQSLGMLGMIGDFKISPDGQWFAIGGNQLYRLDNSTGLVSSPLVLPVDNTRAFSSDSRYCYGINSSAAGNELLKFSLQATDIPASGISVAQDAPNVFWGQFQLGPDYKIYFIRNDLAEQNTINVARISCEFRPMPDVELEFITITKESAQGALLYNGLPTFSDHIFQPVELPGNIIRRDTFYLHPGDSLNLLAHAAGTSYFWSTGEETSSITVREPGVYRSEVTDGCGGESFGEREVLLREPPAITIELLNAESFCEDGSALLGINGVAPGESVLWSTGETSPIIEVQDTGLYTVSLLDICGEDASADFTVSFEDCPPSEACEARFPNFFSPNGDNANDRFGIFTNCEVETYNMRIYSRWGQQVFTSSDPNRYWLGEFNDKAAPAEVYIYEVSYQLVGQEALTQTGQVTLAR